MHNLSGIRTHYPSVRVTDDNSHSRPSGHCDRQSESDDFKTLKRQNVVDEIIETDPNPALQNLL
jgi:hypothetical protein